MDLTRRHAVAALAAAGAVGAGAVDEALSNVDGDLTGSDVRTLEAAAAVLYPDAASVSREFVETYVVGRRGFGDDFLAGVRDALDVLRSTSRRETGRAFPSLSPALRDDVLRATGADRAASDPDGTAAQRVRYYVVDELLYAFYASPAGAELVGSGNPTGYPGGTEAYQQPPGGGRADRG